MTYTYSRQFGQPFTGLGVGLGVARTYAGALYGGSLRLESLPTHGTDAFVRLARRGTTLW